MPGGRLQKFSYRKSPYQRPNQPWVCGRGADERPCPRGPDARGNCHTRAECTPRERDGRWHCTRSELSGGRCADGPLPDGSCGLPVPPCSPRRSMRARRGLATRWVAAVAVAVLAVGMGSGAMSSFLNPGPVTSQHGEIATCSACHTAFDEGALGWLHTAAMADHAQGDSQRCLDCHDLGDDALRAHAQPPEALAQLSAAAMPAGDNPTLDVALTRAVAGVPSSDQRELHCAVCHREHRGREADLNRIDEGRCSVCHTSVFAGFAEGHPEFHGYPYMRRTRIFFDHASHIGKHFMDEKLASSAPDQCKDCHAPDVNGRTMLVEGFEQSCGACHASDIVGDKRADARGVAVLRVPGLDVYTLADERVPVGEWPEYADGAVTPFMEMLLAADERWVAARDELAGIDLLDLSGAEPAVLAAVEDYAWGVKRLLFDLRVDGLEAMRARLKVPLGRPLSTVEVARLSGLLPVDTVTASLSDWMPALLEEVPRHAAGLRVPMPGEAPEASAAVEEPAAEPAAGTAEGTADDAILGSDDILGGDEILGEAPAGDDILGGDEILGEAPAGDDILGGDEILGEAPAGDDILGGDEILGEAPAGDDILGGDDILAGKPLAESAAAAPEPVPEAVEPPRGEDWMVAGGWYRDLYSLRYRPSGHADAFLAAWVDVSAAAASESAPAEALFEALIGEDGHGSCGKCHSVDAPSTDGVQVNWQPALPDISAQGFTRFSHSAHFSLLDSRGCLTCHTLNRDAPFAESFEDRDPMTFASNFSPLEQQICSDCHGAEKASADCLTCHNYHVGRFDPPVPGTPGMMEAGSEEVVAGQ